MPPRGGRRCTRATCRASARRRPRSGRRRNARLACRPQPGVLAVTCPPSPACSLLAVTASRPRRPRQARPGRGGRLVGGWARLTRLAAACSCGSEGRLRRLCPPPGGPLRTGTSAARRARDRARARRASSFTPAREADARAPPSGRRVRLRASRPNSSARAESDSALQDKTVLRATRPARSPRTAGRAAAAAPARPRAAARRDPAVGAHAHAPAAPSARRAATSRHHAFRSTSPAPPALNDRGAPWGAAVKPEAGWPVSCSRTRLDCSRTASSSCSRPMMRTLERNEPSRPCCSTSPRPAPPPPRS